VENESVPSLIVIRGNDQGSEFELESDRVGVGRDPANEIQLHDTEVSRRHAEIRGEEGRYVLVDLDSSNGTFVNNDRIVRRALEDSDEIRIGSSVLLFRAGTNNHLETRVTGQVAIVAGNYSDDSNIIHSVSPEESNRLWVQSLESNDGAPLNDLEVIYRTTMAVRHTLDIDQLLNKILKIIFEWVEADRGCILLVDGDGRLVPKAFHTRATKANSGKLSISKTILDYVMSHRQGVLTSDAKDDSRWNTTMSLLQHNVKEAICVPMQGRYNNMLGMIYIDTSTPPERIVTHGTLRKFHESHLRLMAAIGHQAAMAVEDTRYYTELVQAERLAAIGQTIAMLSHHIKNILQGVQGGRYLVEKGLADTANMLRNLPSSPEAEQLNKSVACIRKGWEISDKNQNRISNLVMDMLSFSKEREPSLEPADLNEVVADVVELMESRADEHGVKLLWRPYEQMPTLTFDPDGLHRAVLNIVTNAIDACEGRENGRVLVTTNYAPRDNVARVIVEDNGSGIPPDKIDAIFKLFHSTKSNRGTGLGLPVSNKIVREHGGKIVVQSEEGKGSRFTVVIPAIRPDGPGDGDPRRTITVPKNPGGPPLSGS
jgi:signal transduction histidine kinase/pSer/pThr/pTyr-binding forkhead associated (FHA) protein